MGTQFSVTVFPDVGVPYRLWAQNIQRSAAGTLLTIRWCRGHRPGVVIGIITGRHPHRRSWMVLGIIASNAVMLDGGAMALPSRRRTGCWCC